MLKTRFKILCSPYSQDKALITKLYNEIENAHQNRAYHNLNHLEHIYQVLEPIKLTTIMEFAIFYHDIVYDVLKIENEEESAKLARERLAMLKVDEEIIEQVYQLIIETKTHEPTSEENALFLDADLAILGSSKKRYKKYYEKIRDEYTIYSDKDYKNGRKKILESMLKKENIYKSNYFKKYYEQKARNNLKDELMLLS